MVPGLHGYHDSLRLGRGEEGNGGGCQRRAPPPQGVSPDVCIRFSGVST